ncbi:MAG: alpha/beta hydrolase [Sedimentisphaerales bacterium]|nr:alpha/beta hydrolase [Sedimentisphaerales bacterium]
MRTVTAGFLAAGLIVGLWTVVGRCAEGIYETKVEPGGEDKFKSAQYRIWIPPSARIIRGVIVHQHGCGRNGISIPYDIHWRALAEKWDCALLGTHYQTNTSCRDWSDPENGSAEAFMAALTTFAGKSGHQELAEVPWVLWGHSGGAAWVMGMIRDYPERIAAAFARSHPWGEDFAEAPGVPILFSMGLRESEGQFAGIWKATNAVFAKMRRNGGCVGLAVDPESSHDCRHSRLLAIPFFDACMARRFGKDGLRPVDESKGWLCDANTFEIAPASRYSGDKRSAGWLPDEATARKWREFVKTGWVTDSTAPQTAPGDLKAAALSSTSVELGWTARADLESGIKTFYYYRDGERIGRYEGPVDPHHNPQGGFQKGNYGDEPNPESLYQSPEKWDRPVMKFTDTNLKGGTTYIYQISTVNWSDLESPKSAPIRVTTPKP